MTDVFVADKKKKERPGSVGRKAARRRAVEYSEVMREEQPTTNPLTTFAVRPAHVSFETQDPEEEVLLLLRRHFLTNVPWIIIWILLVLAPLTLSFFPILAFLPGRFQFITILFWYLFALGYLLERFLSWYFNVYIVTDERVIDIDFYSLIYKEVSAAKIDDIQDVTFTIGGAIRSLFNFGTISIQTAGEKREFDFEDVPRPEVVTKFLNELILEEEREEVEGRVR